MANKKKVPLKEYNEKITQLNNAIVVAQYNSDNKEIFKREQERHNYIRTHEPEKK